MSRKHCQCFEFDAAPGEIKKCIREGHRILILMRGVTGSGKSALVREFIAEAEPGKFQVFSSDDANFQNNITRKLREALYADVPLVIVDAAHEERGDIKKLAEIGVAFSFEVYVAEPKTNWLYKADLCRNLSERNESVADIQRKIALIRETPINWEHIVNGGYKNVVIDNTHIEYEIPICVVPARNPENLKMGAIQSLSNTSTTSVSSTGTASIKLFSMVPEQKMKVMRNAGTMVETIDIYRAHADSTENPLNGFVDGGTFEVPDEWRDPNSIKVKNARSQAPEKGMANHTIQDIPVLTLSRDEIEFAILHAVFPKQDHLEMRHYHELFGYPKAFKLMELLGAEMCNVALPDNPSDLLQISGDHQSFTASMSVEEEILERRIEWHKMKLIAQRNGLGNPDTSSDALIAANLEAELNFGEEEADLTREDLDNIRYLRSAFEMDHSMIEDVYKTAGCSLSAAKKIIMENYGLQENLSVQQPTRTTWSSKVVQARPTVIDLTITEEQKKNIFINPPAHRQHYSILAAHEVAIKARQEIMKRRQAACGVGGMRNLVMHHNSQRNYEENQKRIHQIDQMIRRSHQMPWFVDLHYMSVEGAVALVNEAIEAVKHFRKRGHHVNNRIQIITGKGNRSTNGPQIKPRVLAMLDQRGYKWKEENEGYYIADIG